MKRLVSIIVFRIGVNVIGIPEIHWHNLEDRNISLEKPKYKLHN